MIVYVVRAEDMCGDPSAHWNVLGFLKRMDAENFCKNKNINYDTVYVIDEIEIKTNNFLKKMITNTFSKIWKLIR